MDRCWFLDQWPRRKGLPNSCLLAVPPGAPQRQRRARRGYHLTFGIFNKLRIAGSAEVFRANVVLAIGRWFPSARQRATNISISINRRFKPDASEEVPETRVGVKALKLRLNLQPDQLRVTCVIGFRQPGERSIFISEPCMNERYINR